MGAAKSWPQKPLLMRSHHSQRVATSDQRAIAVEAVLRPRWFALDPICLILRLSRCSVDNSSGNLRIS